MNINDLITRVVNGIIRQEGMPADYDNPGNLRGCPWLAANSPYAKIVNKFWRPGDRHIGIAGLAHLVALHISQGNSLVDFIAGHPGVYSGFAPGADNNNDAVYVADVAKWANIPDATEPMWNYIA